jgi:hypothetical protein
MAYIPNFRNLLDNTIKGPPPPQKKSIFVKKIEIEINAWGDSPSSALSETLWFFIGNPFFDIVIDVFLPLTAMEIQ